MRRRLDLALALVHRPPVLFLDEPTTGLDPQGRTDLWGIIEELVAVGTTVLLTTQYLEEADRLANRIAVVDGGRVIANDTPSRLKSQLGNTVIEMQVQGDGRAERAEKVLTSNVAGRVEREGERIRLSSDEGARVLVEALRALDGDGLSPDGLTVREPSLDDVFLALTGHHAEDGEPDAVTADAGGRKRGGRR
jgi:ABC-type multidrug transport system ATPase subunit